MTVYGDKYAVIHYSGKQKYRVVNVDDCVASPETRIKDGAVFRYFSKVVKARQVQAEAKERESDKGQKQGQEQKQELGPTTIVGSIAEQMKSVLPSRETVLHAYCTGENEARKPAKELIYPFGLNESQIMAVERAFSSQISLIEGPPGTGKTQTILNIIANILLRGETVAILSNNNAAVENVYEKLDKVGLGYLVARLGNATKRKAFFEDLPDTPSAEPLPPPPMEKIQGILETVKADLHAQNEAARLQVELDELTIERRYFLKWQGESGSEASVPLKKYRLSSQKALDLVAYLSHLGTRRIGLRERFHFLIHFRILRVKPFYDLEWRKALIYALQLYYYDNELAAKKADLKTAQTRLTRNRFAGLQAELVAGSMAWFKHHLHEVIPQGTQFTLKTYHKKFGEFLRRFPIVGSSTHSIIKSIEEGTLLDYVIIDEASQQDIVPGILPLGCARNLIVVGDRKQLPHIPANVNVPPPAEFYDCDRYSLLDSFVGVFGDTVPITLLKEHYRCHPRIIQFCNQQFYDNQLVPMTEDKGEEALKLVVTAKGNHTRWNKNQRELDSLLETLRMEGDGALAEDGSRGFIAPYNAQVRLSRERLPAEYVKDTVHKFQGRECGEIVFSTVLDKKKSSQRSLGFVDDPHLVNVAVSRAKNRFTLVTGDDVFAAGNGHISALVRYIEYYADKKHVHRAPVVSAFDLLYQEYDQSLERLNARLRSRDSRYKSEQIVARLLRDVLSGTGYQGITFHCQIALIQLASLANEGLTAREREFMRNGASCDFVLYYKVGKAPLAVIEVDGGSHEAALQAERDNLKDSILVKSGIPMLRLQSVESHVEETIEAFIVACMKRQEAA
ncbi:helicase [Sneathiella chinensis]|uniref:Helicase n=1 Tax=Sneathiella chinensis TaxID=349750 RepID=A0ABQ5U8F3_9PROT|nr:helicase [Sneathiella chinensis]